MQNVFNSSFGHRPFIDEARARLDALRFEHFDATRVGACLGAEIRGLDLSEDLDDAVVAEVHRALVEFKAIFFRDQKISSDAHLAFAARFGELEKHPFLPPDATHDQIISFEKDESTVGYENIWHSDVSWREIPSLGSVLRAREIPKVGGDTIWCDMEAAYEGLEDVVRDHVEDLVAVHDFVNSFGMLLSEEQREERRKEFPPARHPVVRTHPDTGRKSIYVNAIFTSHIEGMEPEESEALLGELVREANYPEYQVRFKWEKDSVAFWDNRVTQHYAVNDYWPRRRVMERVTIIGERPE